MPTATLKSHHFLNAAQSLNNIAEMIEAEDKFDPIQSEAIVKELEMVIRFLTQQVAVFQQNQ